MAPFLTASTDRQAEPAKPVLQTKKSLKPVIPAVPRLFEKKRANSHTTTLPSSNHVIEQVLDGAPTLKDSTPDSPLSIGTQPNLGLTQGNPATQNNHEIDNPQVAGIHDEHEDETPYTSKSNYDARKQETYFQLSPEFYHTPPRTAQNTYPVEFYSAKTCMTPHQPGVSFPYKLDRTIVFGVEPESNQSSPISVPSASSTAFTQPTPLSDSNSYRSQSLYQGYGHLPNLYDQYAPSKLLFVPPAESSSYPAYTAIESEYSAPLPQTSTTLGLSLSQVLEPELYSHNRDSISALGAYLKHQFDTALFADCVLELEIEGQKTEVMLHRVLIAQNPTCRALLEVDMIPEREGRKVIKLDLSDQHLTAPVILSCLRSYYGEPLPTITATTDGLESAMSYLSAGRLLLIPEVEDFGTTAVLSCLTLENLERIFHYALQPYDDATAEKELVSQASDNVVEGAEANIKFGADKLSQGMLEFIAANFPNPFVLDVQAPPSTQLGGYPAIPDPDQGQKISKPELLSIRFGDFPSASHLMPTAEATKMSSILLSLPVSVLRIILGALEQPVRDDISAPIIEERERRRLKAQQNQLEQVNG